MHSTNFPGRAICLLFFLSLVLFSCQKENEKAVILLSPLDIHIAAKSSDVVVIQVKCSSPFEMKRLVIYSRVEGGYAQTELDSSISGKEFSFPFEYMVPDLTDSTSITLEFALYDDTNEKVSNYRVINVIPSYTYLVETAGHELYSGKSGKQNGYNLLTGVPNYLHLSADSADVHIADTTNSETLLNRWVSPAGAEFVKFNGFDYANSTNISVKEAWSAGLKLEFINKLEVGDIYITKIRSGEIDQVYRVLKITGIVDLAGSESDRYVFNIKK
jgi:hypothetical protein